MFSIKHKLGKGIDPGGRMKRLVALGAVTLAVTGVALTVAPERAQASHGTFAAAAENRAETIYSCWGDIHWTCYKSPSGWWFAHYNEYITAADQVWLWYPGEGWRFQGTWMQSYYAGH